MALPRNEVTDGLLGELGRFEELVRPMTPAEWATPSRCDGWTVGDVAAHVIGSMADVTGGRLEGLGSPEATAREVAERAGRSADELADECAAVTATAATMLDLFDDAAWEVPAPGGYVGTLGDGIEALWYDTWIHADDIRAALARPSEIGTGWHGAVSHVAFELDKRNWHGAIPTEADAAMAFVLTATGRLTPTGVGAPPNIYA
jgi:uncharacterized protein (TIGR03083 family)